MSGYISVNDTTKNLIKAYNYNQQGDIQNFTSIIMATHNQLQYTKMCIESIRKFTPKNTYEIIVVDNNSSDDTLNYLNSQEDIIVISNEENKGLPSALNQGFKISKGESILFLNNDTIVTPNWLNNLEKALYSSDEVGAVGPITNNSLNYQQIDVNYSSLSELLNFSIQINQLNLNNWDYKAKLIGFCWMIKKDVLNDIGLFDEIFNPGGFEDDDLSFRMICKDYKILLCKDVFIHHFGKATINNYQGNYESLLQDNRKKVNDKWGFTVDYSSSVRFDLIELIKENSDRAINVLEVGCGIGTSLLEIKSRYKNARVFGLEISENAGKIAKHCANTIIGNIETTELPYENNFFDYVIFGDVLEHLQDPWATLKKIKKYIKPNGFILGSIPNIMHTSVIRGILNGRFPYADAGILDKTHLRFFTLAEIQILFNSAEFEIVHVGANAFYSFADDEQFINNICKIFGENLKQQYSVYQYLIKAKNVMDLSIYENEDMVNLKFRLMRIDNNIDVEENLEDIFKIYKKYKKDYANHLVYLIQNNTIDQELVLKTIKEEAINRGLIELSNLLGEI